MPEIVVVLILSFSGGPPSPPAPPHGLIKKIIRNYDKRMITIATSSTYKLFKYSYIRSLEESEHLWDNSDSYFFP